MIRRPPRSTQSRSSAASDVYKRQVPAEEQDTLVVPGGRVELLIKAGAIGTYDIELLLSLIHISEPTRPY